MDKTHRWTEAYVTEPTLEDFMTLLTRGDFARGQRTLKLERVEIGTFARGQHV